jgi:hypothetical protein
MHELRAPTRRALAEIVSFEKRDIVASRRRIQSDSDPGGSSADDDQIPGTGSSLQSDPHLFSVHGVDVLVKRGMVTHI